MSNATPADWDRYRGNNHFGIDKPNISFGGHVSFREHIGNPLSQRLWEDLIHRLRITGLCVYKWSDSQWTIGWGQGHCCILLDKEDNVYDINYNPVWR